VQLLPQPKVLPLAWMEDHGQTSEVKSALIDMRSIASHYGIVVVRMKVRGRGREAVTVRGGVAAVVQMDVDSEVGGRERVVRVKTIGNGLCKMMPKRLCVVHSVTPHHPQHPDRKWARHERGRYRKA
jgi:hypothetical protein